MKFYAELFLKDEKTAANLVRSMFKDIDPESSIHIKGMNATMEIVFEKEPNYKLMDAIAGCEVKELIFNCTEALANDSVPTEISNQEDVQDETVDAEEAESSIKESEVQESSTEEPEVQESSTEEPEVQESATEESEVQESATEESEVQEIATEEPEVQESCTEEIQEDSKVVPEVNEKKKRKYNCSKGNGEDISVLQELATGSSSFEKFVEEVCKWLNLGKDKSEYFTKLINKFLEEENPEKAITTKGIEAITLSLGYNLGMKNVLGKGITKKLIEVNSTGTLIPFLKNVIKFRTNFEVVAEKNVASDFSNEADSTEESNDSDEESHINEDTKNISSDDANETVVEMAKPEPLTRLPGFPTIPKFEEFLTNLDFSNSVKGGVVEILTAMGIEALDKQLKNKIINVCVFAALAEPSQVDYKDCFKRLGIFYDSTEGNELRMEIAKFVNSFISFAYSGRYSSITTQVFLKGISEFVKSHE